jgi:HlyD family secretion protein/epimerase transport system membrane fusion protein
MIINPRKIHAGSDNVTNTSATNKDNTGASAWAAATPGRLLRGPIVVGCVVVGLFFGGLGTWAAVAPIAGATIAVGVVSPDGSRKTVQHLEGGIITEILVDDGDRVQAGDRLVVLQGTQARASFQVLRGQRRLLAAKMARLLAEQAGAEKIHFPDWLLGPESGDDPELQAIMGAQQDLFTARNELHRGRTAIGRKRIDQLSEELTSLASQIRSQRKQLALLDEEITAKKSLVDRRLIARPDYLALQRLKAEVEGEIAENVGSAARVRQSIGETELQIVNEDAVRLDKIVVELAETRSELSSVEERLHAQEDILTRTSIVAPVSGIIMQIRFHTTGGVVGPGQPILDIVPQDIQLLIDAQVRPVDIDDVALGQTARVHFLSYSERNLPRIMGTVRSVSADSLLDEVSGASYFLAKIEVPADELAKLGEGVSVTPGMPAEVMIMSGERTLVQYLVQPMQDSLRRTFREN